jgi:thiol-disulfide isomerase/thioredoxin
MKHIFLLLSALCAASRLAALPAPDFSVTTSDGQVRRLYQDFVNQGKVVVVEAFFTTCPPCATHAPHFQSLYAAKKAAYPGQVEFLLLSTLGSDNNAKVAAYLSDKMMTMPGAGKDGGSLTALQPYLNGQFGGFFGTPTFWVIAPHTGEVTFDVRSSGGAAGTMTLLGQKIDEYLAPPTQCSLKTPFDKPIDNVQVKIETAAFDTTLTASGTYSVAGIASLKNAAYTLTPSKKTNPLDGLSTYDLVLISRHILGLDTFAQSWKLAAADVNCSGTVTTFDIVMGRRTILGIDTMLPCGSWKFVPDPANTTANGSCQHFRGIRLGDLNGSGYFAPEPDDRAPFAVLANDVRLRAGESRQVQLRAAEAIALAGLQLCLGFDPDGLCVEGVESAVLPDFGEANLNWLRAAGEGLLPLVWVDGAGASVAAQEPLLTLHVTALRDGLLSEMLDFQAERIAPEAVSATGLARRASLFWEKTPLAPVALLRLSPNPARGLCYADVVAERDGEALVQMLDLQGRRVFEKIFAAQTGANRWAISPDAPLRGLCVVRVDGVAVGKVLWAE